MATQMQYNAESVPKDESLTKRKSRACRIKYFMKLFVDKFDSGEQRTYSNETFFMNGQVLQLEY